METLLARGALATALDPLRGTTKHPVTSLLAKGEGRRLGAPPFISYNTVRRWPQDALCDESVPIDLFLSGRGDARIVEFATGPGGGR